MTVCVAVKVHDCMVFAADSAATVSQTYPDGSSAVVKVYDHADKVFNLRRDLPIVAMTCGMGHIGDQSISSLAKQLRFNLTEGPEPLNRDNYTLQSVVERTHGFISERFHEANPTPNGTEYLEFWVGGYGSNNTTGEAWKVTISGGLVQEPAPVFEPGQAAGLSWGGQGGAIARLIFGVDPDIVRVLSEAGLKPDLAISTFQAARGGLEQPFVQATMPITDAIRLAKYLVDTTKGFYSFVPGANIVGGPSDVATVTKWEGFKWIQRKHFYPASLNQGDLDHVC